MSDVRIETDRLILKEITLEDSDFIVRLRSNPEVYKYFKNPIKIDIESHNKWFNESYIKDDNRIDMLAIHKTTGENIGVFGIKRIIRMENESLYRGLCKAELSYILSADKIGNGFATEALEGIINEFKIIWKIRFFSAEIHKSNKESIRFIERLGFRLNNSEGEMLEYALYKD